MLEQLGVSWYQCDFLLRLAKLFTFTLSLQAILMNMMCAEQRSGESAETVKRIDNNLRATFLNVCWRQELLKEYFTALSFSLPLEVTVMWCDCMCTHSMCAKGRHHDIFFKVFQWI